MLSWQNNRRIAVKLAIPLAMVALSSGILVWVARGGLVEVGQTAHEVGERYAARKRAVLETAVALNETTINEKNALLVTDPARKAAFETAYGQAM